MGQWIFDYNKSTVTSDFKAFKGTKRKRPR